jgi:N utilization substance protein A
MLSLSLLVKSLEREKNLTDEIAYAIIEKTILSAYKRRFGDVDNVVVEFSKDEDYVKLFEIKDVVDEVFSERFDILLEDAKEIDKNAKLDDEIKVELNLLDNFDRTDIQTAKQIARQELKEFQQNSLYSEFKNKKGEIVMGFYLRERNGNIFVDLGKTEGILPEKFQSPRESYGGNDRMKVLIQDIVKRNNDIKITLSRTHPEFIQKLLELEISEIDSGIIQVYKIVREPGIKTKMAVYSERKDIDPVAICIGIKGNRIQSIRKELEGEIVDVVEYSNDPVEFIKNALSPATVDDVIIVDKIKKSALAIVKEDQLVFAIGKQGINVRLTNRLVDWNINVRTKDTLDDNMQFDDFKDVFSGENNEMIYVYELPGIDDGTIKVLNDNGITYIEEIIDLTENNIRSLNGMDEERFKFLLDILNNIDVNAFDENENNESNNFEDNIIVEEDNIIVGEDKEFIEYISEHPYINKDVIELLEKDSISKIEQLIGISDEKLIEVGLSEKQLSELREILSDIEFIDDE